METTWEDVLPLLIALVVLGGGGYFLAWASMTDEERRAPKTSGNRGASVVRILGGLLTAIGLLVFWPSAVVGLLLIIATYAYRPSSPNQKGSEQTPLAHLAALHAQGVLSDEEFKAKSDAALTKAAPLAHNESVEATKGGVADEKWKCRCGQQNEQGALSCAKCKRSPAAIV